METICWLCNSNENIILMPCHHSFCKNCFNYYKLGEQKK